MKVLFDLDVLIDVAIRWREFPDSKEMFARIAYDPRHIGLFPGCGYTTLYYIFRQSLSDERTRQVLAHFRRWLVLGPFTNEVAEMAHRLQLADLEDACVAATALDARCDCIVTRDFSGFSASPIVAREPTDLLAELNA